MSAVPAMPGAPAPRRLAGERCQPFRAASVLQGEDGDGQAVLHQALPARLPRSAGFPHLNPNPDLAALQQLTG